MSEKETSLLLVDLDAVVLRRSDVLRAAETAERTRRGAGAVRVARRWYDPIPLVSQAAGVEPRQLSPRATIAALQRLDFAIDEVEADPRYLQPSAEHPEGEGEPIKLTRNLLLELQRHGGQWVAIRDGRIVEHAQSLRDLSTALGEGEATVLRVPLDTGGQREI